MLNLVHTAVVVMLVMMVFMTLAMRRLMMMLVMMMVIVMMVMMPTLFLTVDGHCHMCSCYTTLYRLFGGESDSWDSERIKLFNKRIAVVDKLKQ